MSNDIMALIDRQIKKIEKDLIDIGQTDVSNLIEDELKISVVKNLYGKPESLDYDRTGMMFESIKANFNKNANGIDIYSYMDLENTSPKHKSWDKNNTTNVDKYLDEWMEFGHGGMAWYDGNLMFTEAQYVVNKKAKKLVKSKLKLRGYKVKE